MSKENQLPEETEVLETEATYEEVEIDNEGGEDVSSSEHSIMALVQQHKTNLMFGGGLVLALILYFAFFNSSSPETEDEAGNAIFQAVRYYEGDSLNLALNGDGNSVGLLELADEYSGSKVGNLCNFYIGAIYLRQGNAAEALNSFEAVDKGNNFISASAYAAMASITEDQGDMEGAANLYEKAAEVMKNGHTTPFFWQQAARCYQQNDNPSAALRLYKQIRDEYPNSQEGQQVDKYISFLSPEDEE